MTNQFPISNIKDQEKNKKQKKFYNSSNPQYLDHEKNRPYAVHLIRRLLTQLPQPESLNVLEIGAGQGRFTLELARHVGEVTATDLSEKQIEILIQKIQKSKVKSQNYRSKLKDNTNIRIYTNHTNDETTKSSNLKSQNCNIDCFVFDLLKAPSKELKGKTFDAIVGFFMLHHIDRSLYPQVLKNILPLLKKRGRLVFIEPNCLYPFHLVEMMIEPDMHWEIEKQIYSNYLGTFHKAAIEAGLQKITFERFGFFPPPLINRFPDITKSEIVIERIPLVREFLTPFVLVSYQR